MSLGNRGGLGQRLDELAATTTFAMVPGTEQVMSEGADSTPAEGGRLGGEVGGAQSSTEAEGN